MCARFKSGVFASCALQIEDTAGLSLSRRARVIRPRRESAPAFNVMSSLQPKVYLDLLQSVLRAYGLESAIGGAHMVDTLRDTV